MYIFGKKQTETLAVFKGWPYCGFYCVPSFVPVKVICETAQSKFEGIRQQMKELKEKVPTDQYYRWED